MHLDIECKFWFLFEYYKKALEIYLDCTFGKTSSKLEKQKKYLFIYSPWLGYFSWVTEKFTKNIICTKHEELTLIVPDYLNRKFISDSLKLFPKSAEVF